MRGKLWPVADEKKLRDCVAAGMDTRGIIQEFGGKYSVDGIRMKMFRLGLVDRSESLCRTTTTSTTTTSSLSAAPVAPVSVARTVDEAVAFLDLKIPDRLPSIEDKLKVLCAASTALEQPNLSRNAVFRLRALIDSLKSYQAMFSGYVKISELEKEVVELRKKLAFEMAKSQDSVAQDVSS